MGKGSYLGGSTVLRAEVGYTSRRSKGGTMSPAEVQADLDRRKEVAILRSAKTKRAMQAALAKLDPKAAAKAKQQKEDDKVLAKAHKERRAKGSAMKGVIVERKSSKPKV